MKGGFIANKLRVGRKNIEKFDHTQKMEKIVMDGFTWLDLQNPDRKDMEELAKMYNLNGLNVEDCLTRSEVPKLDSYENHFFVILHFPPLVKKTSISKNSQISVFVAKDFLITVHQGELESLLELVGSCKTNPDQQYMGKRLDGSTSVLLHAIIDRLVDDLMHTSRKIMANLDEMEEMVFDATKPVAKNISLLRREINRLRRISVPLKRFVKEIAKDIQRFENTSSDLTLHYDDVIDHIDKVIETLEESRETMEIYKDTDFVLSTQKTNKVLGLLTIVFALAIPASVLGTFYGMNINLPGGETGAEDATFFALGQFTAFIVIMLISGISAIIMWIYFKKNGWLNN